MFLLENSENIHELEKNAKMLEKINTIILNFKFSVLTFLA